MPVEAIIDPFPGLRPFEANEEHLFFGREGQSEEILRRLRQHRFLAVVGSSGSGKSSLVRAGLLPYLFGGFLSGAGSHWRVALFRPGSDPVGNLAKALNSPGVIGTATEDPATATQNAVLMEVSLRRSGLGLIEAVRLAGLPEQEQVLVLVDQFEELFRFAGAVDKPRHENDAAAFVKLLLEAGAQREVPIYVALTMRSDFIGDCARYRGLPEAVTTGLYLIPRMTREERRAAVVEPVRVGGGSIAPRLVNRLLNDMGDDPDQLPILQHAMMRTWDYWKEHGGDRRPIDIDDYLAIGGMADALSQHADEAYASLPDDRHRQIARRVFQALSEKGADHRETRRPTTVETLAQVAGAPVADVIHVIEEFRRPGRSFLMPAAGVALEAGSVIDISHESLIRGWQRLRQWVAEETESATVYRRLAETAELHARGTAGLWHDPDLQYALAWQQSEHPTAAWGNRYHPNFEQAVAFLKESRTARDDEQRRQTNRRRLIMGGTGAALAGMTLLAITALVQWNQAEQHRAMALSERDRAERNQTEARHERDRAKLALAGLGRIADTVVFDVVQNLRRYGLQEALTRDMLDRAIQGYDQTIELSPNAQTYNSRGAAYWMKGDYDRAIADSDEAIRLDPKYAHAYNSRGLAHFDKKDYDLSIADYDQAIALDPKFSSAYNNRGNAQKAKGELDKAIADYDQAITLDPKYVIAYINRGIAYYDKKDYDHAIADYDHAIVLDPKQAWPYSTRGNAYSAKGEHDRAIADYDHAITLDPKYAVAYRNRGLTYRDKKDYDRAIADYSQAITLDPKYIDAYNSRGLAFYSKRDYDEAIADYDRAIALNPKYVFAYNNRGNAYRAKNDPDRAIADYVQAIALDPKYVDAYVNRGIAYYDKGDYDRAIADYDRAIALDPKYAWPYNTRGNAYSGKGDLDRAIADYDQAIALDSKDPITYRNRGLAYYEKKDYDRAIADYSQAITLDPQYVDAYNSRGLGFYNKGDYDRAIADYDHAIAYNAKYVFAYINRGNAYKAKGDLDRALTDYDEAIALDPKYATAYNSRGLAYYDKRDYDRAIADYDEAVAINPQYAVAYDNRGDAYKGKGNLDQAIADYSRAITIDPRYVDAYNDRGMAYYDKREYDKAISDYDQAIALSPKYANAYNNRGNAHRAKGDLDRAMADFDRAIGFRSNYAAAYANRGDVYMIRGKVGDAFGDYDQVVRLEPNDGYGYLKRALSEIYLGKAASAVDDLTTALRLRPANHYFVIWLHIARARAGQRDDDELRDNAKKLDPAQWPWPVVDLLLGSSTPEAVRARAQSADNENTRRNQVCEADFYLGTHFRETGAQDKARRLFEAAVEGCPKNFWEYMTAKNELQGIK